MCEMQLKVGEARPYSCQAIGFEIGTQFVLWSVMLTQTLSLLQTKLIAGIEDAKAALRHILQCKWIAVGCEGQDVSKEGRLCLLQVQHSSVCQRPMAL